jgi:phosphonate transport system substrate-binding protein
MVATRGTVKPVYACFAETSVRTFQPSPMMDRRSLDFAARTRGYMDVSYSPTKRALMMNRLKIAASLTVVFALLAIPAGAAAKQNIRIGVADGKGPQSAAQSFGPFLKQMNASPNYSFEMVVFGDGDKQYQALKDGKVDLAFFGPATYVKARYEFKAEPLVAEAGDLRSMIVVAKNSPLKSAAELKGKSIALGYEGSTTTHLLPLLLLSKHGVRDANLGKLVFNGDQTKKIVESVLTGKTVAGGISENLYQSYKDQLRVLDTSESLPGATFVASPKLPPHVIRDLRALFVKYVPSAGTQRFPKGAVAVNDATYNRVRFLCKVVLGRMYL